MHSTAFRIIVPATVLVATLPLRAHHSASATFDDLKPLTLTGVVAEVRLENPHIIFLLNVADPTGRVTRWMFEASAPTAAARGGFRRDAVKVGATVTITGAHARDEAVNIGIARQIVLEDGRSFRFGPAAP